MFCRTTGRKATAALPRLPAVPGLLSMGPVPTPGRPRRPRRGERGRRRRCWTVLHIATLWTRNSMTQRKPPVNTLSTAQDPGTAFPSRASETEPSIVRRAGGCPRAVCNNSAFKQEQGLPADEPHREIAGELRGQGGSWAHGARGSSAREVAGSIRRNRFGYDRFEYCAARYGCEIGGRHQDRRSPRQDMREDWTTIVPMLAARLYGR